MIFYDTETCGLHGMPVLIQYAIDNGSIKLYNIWKQPIAETLELIDMFMRHESGVVGFNLAFDHFHLCKIYTTLSLHPDWNDCPEDIIYPIAKLEKEARDGPCLKPVKSCDLMLHARKTEYQSTMDRHDIRIKRVPTGLAWQLADELCKRVKLKDIYFSRFKDKHRKQWQVFDIETDGEINSDFKDVVLKFAPSSALKVLAIDALGESDVLLFKDIEVPKKAYPIEYGYAPFALAVGTPQNWRKAWPDMIQFHIDHWAYHKTARIYAEKDVDYTRRLYQYFGSPEPGDTDSELACMVAAVRWKGFRINYQGIKGLRIKSLERSEKAPKAPNNVKKYIWPHLTPTEQLVTEGSTKKVILETIAKFVDDDDKPTEAARKSQECLDARTAAKEVELFDKLLLAGRFHASFKVIGALSSRMSGADGLNAQGIKSSKEIRSCFPLNHDGTILCGGDFESFEVVLAEALYKDEKLREELLSGKKIHALFAEELYPEEDYQSILATKGTEDDLYTKGKQGVFSQIYGGDHNTIHDRLGVDIEQAEKAASNWAKRFPGIGIAQQKNYDDFCSMRQPGGIGTRVEWHEPKDYVESLLGFRRYFTLENSICKALFELGEDPPKSWQSLKIKVVRRDREQTAGGAIRSACFASAFAIQAANMRAAMNHQIQSSGAQITKEVQRKIWEIQPNGIRAWYVQPMNIHDEIMCVAHENTVNQIEEVVLEEVKSFKPKVPLISIDWSNKLNSWADK